MFRDLFSNPRRSILGETHSVAPMVVPVRGYLDDIRRMMVGDYYIGEAAEKGTFKECLCERVQGSSARSFSRDTAVRPEAAR